MSVLLVHRVCVHVLLLARSLIDHGARTGGCDQQWAAEKWTDRRCVSSINSFYARRAALERIYFIFHDAEKLEASRSILAKDRCGAVLPSCGQ